MFYKVTMIDFQFDEMTVAYYTEMALLEAFPDVTVAPDYNRDLAVYHTNKDGTIGYGIYVQKMEVTE